MKKSVFALSVLALVLFSSLLVSAFSVGDFFGSMTGNVVSVGPVSSQEVSLDSLDNGVVSGSAVTFDINAPMHVSKVVLDVSRLSTTKCSAVIELFDSEGKKLPISKTMAGATSYTKSIVLTTTPTKKTASIRSSSKPVAKIKISTTAACADKIKIDSLTLLGKYPKESQIVISDKTSLGEGLDFELDSPMYVSNVKSFFSADKKNCKATVSLLDENGNVIYMKNSGTLAISPKKTTLTALVPTKIAISAEVYSLRVVPANDACAGSISVLSLVVNGSYKDGVKGAFSGGSENQGDGAVEGQVKKALVAKEVAVVPVTVSSDSVTGQVAALDFSSVWSKYSTASYFTSGSELGGYIREGKLLGPLFWVVTDPALQEQLDSLDSEHIQVCDVAEDGSQHCYLETIRPSGCEQVESSYHVEGSDISVLSSKYKYGEQTVGGFNGPLVVTNVSISVSSVSSSCHVYMKAGYNDDYYLTSAAVRNLTIPAFSKEYDLGVIDTQNPDRQEVMRARQSNEEVFEYGVNLTFNVDARSFPDSMPAKSVIFYTSPECDGKVKLKDVNITGIPGYHTVFLAGVKGITLTDSFTQIDLKKNISGVLQPFNMNAQVIYVETGDSLSQGLVFELVYTDGSTFTGRAQDSTSFDTDSYDKPSNYWKIPTERNWKEIKAIKLKVSSYSSGAAKIDKIYINGFDF